MLLVSLHLILGYVPFSGWCGPGKYNPLVFSGFSLILHLARHIAKFKRSCCKNFAAKRTFKLKAHCAVSSANWDREFVCGAVLVDR